MNFSLLWGKDRERAQIGLSAANMNLQTLQRTQNCNNVFRPQPVDENRVTGYTDDFVF